MEGGEDKRIAVLIDADNVSSKYVSFILDEISNYGTPTYRRIYGDWTSTRNSTWKDVLLDYSIVPIQQYNYTKGKNATDFALIIDAMDILYSQSVEGFCIVSSDSDYTRLASRLREAGMLVIGMGEQKTPKPFIAACDKFKYLNVLAESAETESAPKPAAEAAPEEKAGASIKEVTRAIKAIVNDISDDDGWASLSTVGNMLNKRYPDFDSRNYGYSKLSSFVKSLGQFKVESRQETPGIPSARQTYISLKDGAR